LAYLLPVVLDREVEVVVHGLAPGEVEQALVETGECIAVPLAFVCELAEDVDHATNTLTAWVWVKNCASSAVSLPGDRSPQLLLIATTPPAAPRRHSAR
jgi:hypothetical protein